MATGNAFAPFCAVCTSVLETKGRSETCINPIADRGSEEHTGGSISAWLGYMIGENAATEDRRQKTGCADHGT
jgi:hypothetical protein